MLSRRQFLHLSGAAAVVTTARAARAASLAAGPAILSTTPVLGQGEFRYRLVPNWGVLGDSTPVNNGHGLAIDREGHVILLTDEVRNNVIIYDRQGRLVHKWGTRYPGAHGLSLVREGAREVLFLTDLRTHRVVKTTLDGQVLAEWTWPADAGRYEQEDQYRPSWTLHRANGEFFVLDGYGRDYILHYDASGKRLGIFGGAEGGITHWGPHGGMIDRDQAGRETLLIAMSDQQYLLRLDLSGRELHRTPLPGGNPRQIRRFGSHAVVAHLADNWPRDRQSRGFISILDAKLRVVANVGGTSPEYDDHGNLRAMRQVGEVFIHPHDAIVDADGSLYVAQFDSGRTYPLKFERV